jgi:hypothetical protein
MDEEDEVPPQVVQQRIRNRIIEYLTLAASPHEVATASSSWPSSRWRVACENTFRKVEGSESVCCLFRVCS